MEENHPWDRRASVRTRPAVADLQKAREQLISLLPRLRRFARVLARNLHDADDLVQGAIERALARSDPLRLESRPLPWMLDIIRSAWGEAAPLRRAPRRSAPVEEAEPEIRALKQALARLPSEQHTAIALVLIEDLSYSEAAELISVPVTTLTARLLRGRDTLQTLLDTEARR